MKLVRWNPASDVDVFHRNFNKFFNDMLDNSADSNSIMSWTPRVDIQESDETFEIHADIPGVEKENIKVSVDKGVLTIGGHKEVNREEDKANYHRLERYSGEYSRSFHLPDKVDAEKIKASYKDGVLSVVLPKKEEVKKKEISINID